MAVHCVTTDDPEQTGTQCYHRGELARGDLTRGEMGKSEMEKGDAGHHKTDVSTSSKENGQRGRR